MEFRLYKMVQKQNSGIKRAVFVFCKKRLIVCLFDWIYREKNRQGCRERSPLKSNITPWALNLTHFSVFAVVLLKKNIQFGLCYLVTWLITIIFTDAQCMQKRHTPGIQKKTCIHKHIQYSTYSLICIRAEQTSHVVQPLLRTDTSSTKPLTTWGSLKASTRWSFFSVVPL